MLPISDGLLAAVANLNQPGNYLHWSIFTVSLANLVLIAVMVVIFGVALLMPFPRGRHEVEGPAPEEAEPALGPPRLGEEPPSPMWTARLRRHALALLPPGKLLPDRQPAYVSSWVYVFGVATLAALGVAIVSGFAIALGGSDWWHYNLVGHFFNSLHLWSVELFMAFMVIHLWGKFWMAAWRGRRALTWITGVAAFLASIGECFTGYVSQQNFDSQWISTSGKDAINATGLGSFFNLLNFGQMLLWHVLLLPIVLIALVGAHVLLVRVRGVAHPLPGRRVEGRVQRRAAARNDASEWRGPTRTYDILKEAATGSTVALVLVVLLAGLLSSPDVPPVTVQSWARVAPADFMATAASELAGTSETATYGPPYNTGSASVQGIGVSWQLLAGVGQRIDTAETFVLSPLAKLAPTDPTLAVALRTYGDAALPARTAWDRAYLKAVERVSFERGLPTVPAAHDGPVPR
ncbi:MAG: cytochrome b N-terminal domain-containing protein, partial [Candidatus Dormibacteria bacterium]